MWLLWTSVCDKISCMKTLVKGNVKLTWTYAREDNSLKFSLVDYDDSGNVVSAKDGLIICPLSFAYDIFSREKFLDIMVNTNIKFFPEMNPFVMSSQAWNLMERELEFKINKGYVIPMTIPLADIINDDSADDFSHFAKNVKSLIISNKNPGFNSFFLWCQWKNSAHTNAADNVARMVHNEEDLECFYNLLSMIIKFDKSHEIVDNFEKMDQDQFSLFINRYTNFFSRFFVDDSFDQLSTIYKNKLMILMFLLMSFSSMTISNQNVNGILERFKFCQDSIINRNQAPFYDSFGDSFDDSFFSLYLSFVKKYVFVESLSNLTSDFVELEQPYLFVLTSLYLIYGEDRLEHILKRFEDKIVSGEWFIQKNGQTFNSPDRSAVEQSSNTSEQKINFTEFLSVVSFLLENEQAFDLDYWTICSLSGAFCEVDEQEGQELPQA